LLLQHVDGDLDVHRTRQPPPRCASTGTPCGIASRRSND
jgi:hypothetical protein